MTSTGKTTQSDGGTSGIEATIARQDIEYLRRLYATATDLIGTGKEGAIAEGRAIYHRIFTPDALIRTTSGGEENYRAKGPDEWVDVVADALAKYRATQHLIGTQIVDIVALELDAQSGIVAGKATMQSYLQAWHEEADSVWLFLGTYTDRVEYIGGTGWQILEMTLDEVAGETRALGDLA